MERMADVENYDISYVSSQIGSPGLNGIAVNRTHDAVRKGLTNYPHSVSGFICAVCIKGHAELKINFQRKELKPGTLMIVLPGSMMEPVIVSDDLHIDTIFFSPDLILMDSFPDHFVFFQEIQQMPCIQLSDSCFDIFRKHHSTISMHYYREQSISKMDILKCLLQALLYEIRDLYSDYTEQSKRHTRAAALTYEFFDLLRQYHKEERSVSFYAGKMHLTTKYLTTIIRKQTGKSILNWINEAVIAHAKFVLKTSNLSIMEVTDLLHFNDSSLFCRFFKRHTNSTPSEYRYQ